MRGANLLAIVVALTLGTPASGASSTVKVEAGDTLWAIARRHGCGIEALRRANGLDPSDPIVTGRKLLIPSCAGRVRDSDGTYEVKPGDTLSGIALRHRTTVATLMADNGLERETIRAGQTLRVGTPEPDIKVAVVPGQSVGRPQKGRLMRPAQLPADGGYYRRNPTRSYGAQHVIDHVRRAVAKVRRRYPDVHRLAIGDISAKSGGYISGHRSHQSGRDVDLGLYFEREPEGYPEEFVTADRGRLHLGATWALIETLWKASRETGGPSKVFLDYRVQGKLYEYAARRGVPKASLHGIFQYPDGKGAHHRFVAHEPQHADHLHVRFSCPPHDVKCD